MGRSGEPRGCAYARRRDLRLQTRLVTRASRGFWLPAVVVLLAACSPSAPTSVAPSSSEGPALTVAAPSPSPSIEASASPTQAARTLIFQLQPYGLAPGQTFRTPGTVTIDIAGGGYTLTVAVSGLVPGSLHKLDIHAGSCAVPNGDLTSILVVNFPADASGNLVFVRQYTRPWVVPTSGQFAGRLLSVHLRGDAGPSPTLDCVDLTN